MLSQQTFFQISIINIIIIRHGTTWVITTENILPFFRGRQGRFFSDLRLICDIRYCSYAPVIAACLPALPCPIIDIANVTRKRYSNDR